MTIRKWDVLFVVVGIGIVTFFLLAPPQTTPKIPVDAAHQQILDEKACTSCHQPGSGVKPLPGKHPRKDRCFFCHKRK